MDGLSHSNDLWYVGGYCDVWRTSARERAIRPVISLKSGVEISDTEGENGASVSTAYTLAK